MITYIYDLSDPRTGHVRYVGKSVNPKERLATHIREARQGSVVHSRRWIDRWREQLQVALAARWAKHREAKNAG